MPREHKLKTARWAKVTKAVVRRDKGVCSLCGHAGAESADHQIPLSWITDPVKKEYMKYTMSNLRAAHFKPCPVCNVKCQSVRFNLPLDAGKSKVADRARQNGSEVGYRSTQKSSSAEHPGRDW